VIGVLYTNPSSVTGRAIGRAFGGAWGTARIANRRRRHLTYLVRWGSSRQVPWTVDEEVNCRDSVALAANKYAALECLSAHGVPTVPRFFSDRTFTEEELTSYRDQPRSSFLALEYTTHSSLILSASYDYTCSEER
jgi:hypothetical protein